MRLLPQRISVLLVSEFILSFACFLASALYVFGPAGINKQRLLSLVVAAFSVVLACFLNGLYQNLKWRSRVALVLQLCSVFGMVLLLQGVFAYAGGILQVGRWVMLIGAVLNFLVMVNWRIAYAAVLKRLFPTEPVLFLGTDDVVCEIAGNMAERPELGFTVAGFLSDGVAAGTEITGGGKVEGRIDDLAEVARRLQVRRIVVGTDEMRRRLPVAALVAEKRRGVTVEEAGSTYELVCGRVCSRTFRPSQIVFANELAVRPVAMAMQSVYSNLAGLILFICSVPVVALARLAIRMTSAGDALLSEQFAGMNGIPFTASRLRCTEMGDPEKVTVVGRFLRALHLEYLPRIGNVVRGEMALVGPAAVRLEFAEFLAGQIPVYRQRQLVKPGLTGWTQIQTEDTDIPDAIRELETDLYYTKFMSLSLDAYILLHALRGIFPFEED